TASFLPFLLSFFVPFRVAPQCVHLASVRMRVQLAYFAHPKQNFVHGVYAGAELLLFGPHKLITDIDFNVRSLPACSSSSYFTHPCVCVCVCVRVCAEGNVRVDRLQ